MKIKDDFMAGYWTATVIAIIVSGLVIFFYPQQTDPQGQLATAENQCLHPVIETALNGFFDCERRLEEQEKLDAQGCKSAISTLLEYQNNNR